jgi:nucleotide-binding universal stress UspA family protein
MLFKTLLVPLDGTSESSTALPFAIVLARRCGARLVLLRVVDSSVPAYAERRPGTSAALDSLSQIAEEVYQSGIEAEVRVSTGEVVSEIMRVANLERADAMVIATHSGLFDRMIAKSTARQLITRSQIPVFVLRPGGQPVTAVRTVIVAVDGSPGAAQALDEAVSLARATGATLELVRVSPRPRHFAFDPLVASALGGLPDGDGDAEAFALAQSYVTDLARSVNARGVTATSRVMVGAPGEKIVAAAQQVNADVIVMSTRAYPGAIGALLGSTADEVVRRAGRPVLLVRRRHGTASSTEGLTLSGDARGSAQSAI